MKLRSDDTIAAVATPLGVGAISVVRMSGPQAISLAEKVFRGTHRLSATPGHTLRHGRIVDRNNENVDEVLVAVFRAPNSYTGEDLVEISCHGGVYVTKRVLMTLVEAGARQADPGEFTRRAFLNGKMDLSQAEAVSDIISAGSERALRNSNAQLAGNLASRVHQIKGELVRLCSLLELELDFSEEGERFVRPDEVLRSLENCSRDVQSAVESFRFGKVLRDGIGLAIVGRPNVGKSSLFNKLLQEERSIVSPAPGTTRDFLEEAITLDGLSVRLFDTAGLRPPSEGVEAEGIARTISVMKSADLVLLVLDATDPRSFPDDLDSLRRIGVVTARSIVAVNKIDLVDQRTIGPADALKVSAVTGEGVDGLKKKIFDTLVVESKDLAAEVHLTSHRQAEALERCLGHLSKSKDAMLSGMSGEFISADLRMAVDAISEVTGEVTTDDILNEVFSRFCIGK